VAAQTSQRHCGRRGTFTTYLQTHPGSARSAAEHVLPLIASGELALLIDELPLAAGC
jgi:hypothetical protein